MSVSRGTNGSPAWDCAWHWARRFCPLQPAVSGLWGARSAHWSGFLKYAAEVNWYLPANLIPAVAVVSTACELGFGLALVGGWRVRWAAYGRAALLMMCALAMASGDPKSPFDYSVFTASMGALLLGCTARKEETK
jgi:putative oxidoreductase